MSTNGNLLVGITADSGDRLQVSGSSRFVGDVVISGSGATSATYAFTIQNSNGANILRTRSDGAVYIEAVGTIAQLFFSGNDAQISRSTSGLNGLNMYGPSNASHTLTISSVSSDNYGNGALSSLRFSGNFISSTGNTAFSYMLLNGTINQTGTSTSIIRGLYINPTITAAADFRAIEWSNNAATAPSASWGLYGAGTAPNFLSGSLGIGVVPFSGSAAINSSVEIGPGNLIVNGYASIGKINPGGYGAIGSNFYLDSSGNLRRKNAEYVSIMDMPTGGFVWRTAAVGATNSIVSLTQLMVLDNGGNLGLGVTSPTAKLDVRGNTFVSGTLDILDAEIN